MQNEIIDEYTASAASHLLHWALEARVDHRLGRLGRVLLYYRVREGKALERVESKTCCCPGSSFPFLPFLGIELLHFQLADHPRSISTQWSDYDSSALAHL